MHIRARQVNLNAINPYAAAAEKAMAAQRAAEVRKKPLKSGTAVEGEPRLEGGVHDRPGDERGAQRDPE